MTTQPISKAAAVVEFWKAAGRTGDWFSKHARFDRSFRETFLDLHFAAARGECDHWIEKADSALALMILLDQFPRNAFRGTGHMYATDGICRKFAREAEARGHAAQVDPDLRLFFALPFAHSEALSDQDVSVRLNDRLGQPWLSHAEGHRDIIRRFGRFPHRNALLGREYTQEEVDFLKKGGFSG